MKRSHLLSGALLTVCGLVATAYFWTDDRWPGGTSGLDIAADAGSRAVVPTTDAELVAAPSPPRTPTEADAAAAKLTTPVAEDLPLADDPRTQRGSFEQNLQLLRWDVENLDRYPIQQTVKMITLRGMVLLEHLHGRAIKTVEGVRTRDLLPPELQADFDDHHAYADFVAGGYCYIPTRDRYPLYFEIQERSKELRGAQTIEPELIERVRQFGLDALAQAP